jgi:ribulose-5-phosphate 4-epimerase/fuculose-1-phosphate aldolase
MIVENAPASFIAIETETAVRHHLCAVYRLLAHFGMDDLIYTHVSARVPGEDAFLLNPFGFLFDEVSPASLVKVGFDGAIRDSSRHPFNTAGFVIHAGILGGRTDIACVVHTHTRAGVAMSCLADGLLPINQFAAEFFGQIGIHEYEGIASDLDEGARLRHDLGDKHGLILRNHGLLTVGRSIPSAFYLAYYLEQAARVQMDVLATGRDLVQPGTETLAATAAQYTSHKIPALAGHRMWPALLRLLDRRYPGWADD